MPSRRFGFTIAVIITIGAVLASGIVALLVLLMASVPTASMTNIPAPYPAYEGYFCSPKYPYALTEDGRPMVCTTTTTDPHYRFRRP